jgi:hypothetical protein
VKTRILTEADEDGSYSGQIHSAAVFSGGMDYTIVAADAAENAGWAPEEGEASPYHFRIVEGWPSRQSATASPVLAVVSIARHECWL